MKKVLCAIFAAALSFGLNAQSQPLSLSIQDAVDLALKNNVQIKQSQIQLDAAKRSKKNSWNSASPSLTASGGLSKTNKNFNENYSAYVQGSVNVTLSTNLYTDIKNAALKYQAGQISYETACRSVELKVRNAFIICSTRPTTSTSKRQTPRPRAKLTKQTAASTARAR